MVGEMDVVEGGGVGFTRPNRTEACFGTGGTLPSILRADGGACVELTI